MNNVKKSQHFLNFPIFYVDYLLPIVDFLTLIKIFTTILQAILAKVKSLGLRSFLENNVEAHNFIRKVLALPFLPYEQISETFENLVRSLSSYVKGRLPSSVRYFRDFWLRIIQPRGFSVFGLQHRTNNIVESYHATRSCYHTKRRLEIHPLAWDFICEYSYANKKI